MTDKIVYLYDKTSHKLIGTEFLYENAAKPGEYLIPENGTLLEPPAVKEGYDIIFNKNAWSLIKNKNESISEKEIKEAKLKQKLAETDYKLLKNIEAFLANQPLPYDPEQLHNLRQSWRNQLNK